MRVGVSEVLVGRILSPTFPSRVSLYNLILSLMEMKQLSLLNSLCIINFSWKKVDIFITKINRLIVSYLLIQITIQMDLSALRLPNHNAQLLKNCKQIIKEQMTALGVWEEENQKLHHLISQLQEKNSSLSQRTEELQQTIMNLEAENKQLAETMKQKDRKQAEEREQFKINITSLQQQLGKVNELNEELQLTLKQKLIQINEQTKNMKNAKTFSNQAQSHILFLKTELESMRNKMHQQEKQYQAQIQDLKDLNANIKRQFSLIQRDYTSILGENLESKGFQSPISHFHPKRPIELQKIPSTTQFKTKCKRIGNLKPFKETKNPQMSKQLIKIKQQIADQYNRLSQTRETAMKQRVSRTLQNIQNIIGDISHRIIEDSSEYQ